jgi:hypothetical protein
MAIAFVNRAQGGGSVSASSIISPAAAHTAGNLLVALMTFDASGGNFSSITDTAGNTWIQAGTETLAGPGNNKLRIYYAYNCLGNASNVVTVNLSAGTVYRSLVVLQFSGIQTSSDPLSDNKAGTGSSTSIASSSLTVTASSEVICAIIIGVHDTIVGGSGYTLTSFAITGDPNKYYADEYHIVSASEAATGTQSTGSWDIKAASFKIALAIAINNNRTLMGAGI